MRLWRDGLAGSWGRSAYRTGEPRETHHRFLVQLPAVPGTSGALGISPTAVLMGRSSGASTARAVTSWMVKDWVMLGSPVEGSDLAEISAAEVHSMLEAGQDFLLLDVREPDEFITARIEGSQLLPLGELEDRVGEIEQWKDRPVVIHCHLGRRSAKACEQLRAKGFADVKNLSGGIDAWSLTVDAGVPRYS